MRGRLISWYDRGLVEAYKIILVKNLMNDLDNSCETKKWASYAIVHFWYPFFQYQ